MRIQRTAGPLGRAFGFQFTCWKLHVAINAGWYALAIRWQTFGYIQVACDPWQIDWNYGGSDHGGYWPKREVTR